MPTPSDTQLIPPRETQLSERDALAAKFRAPMEAMRRKAEAASALYLAVKGYLGAYEGGERLQRRKARHEMRGAVKAYEEAA